MMTIPPHHSAHGDSPSAGHEAPSEFARPHEPGDLTPLLKHLLSGGSLSSEQMTSAFEAIMSGHAHHGEIGALLALLATRTPSAEELAGAARVMRKHVDRLECSIEPGKLVDTAGTGGAPKTFNVSTAAAIVAAAAGAYVPKHGNRSRTGRGSAEVLERLGVNVDADRATQRKCLEETGVCFCFAVHHHPATRHVMPVRKAVGFPTIFNLLGPLTNPAGATRQLMGVYDEAFLKPLAMALQMLGAEHAIVLHSEDGLDELSISAPTRLVHVTPDGLREDVIAPEDAGLKRGPREAVTARDLDHAAALVRGALDGTEQGPARDMVLLSAGATLHVAGRAASIPEGVELARTAIDEGKAKATLERFAEASRA